MHLHNENQREKDLDLRGFSSQNVLFTQVSMTWSTRNSDEHTVFRLE